MSESEIERLLIACKQAKAGYERARDANTKLLEGKEVVETRVAYNILVLAAEIRVPCLPPVSGSPNWRGHWAVKARERKEFMQQVALAMLSAGVKDLRLSWAKVELEFVFVEHRRRDQDGFLIRGMKPVGDTLVGMGVLLDDDALHLEVSPPVFTVDPVRAPRIIIRIWRRE